MFINAVDMVENPLIGICQANDRAGFAERLHDPPLVCAGVLELVHDNDGVPGAVQIAQIAAALKQVGQGRRKGVEDVKGFFEEETMFFCLPCIVIAFEVCPKNSLTLRRDEPSLLTGEQATVAANEVEEEGVEGSNLDFRALIGAQGSPHAIADLSYCRTREAEKQDSLLGVEKRGALGRFE